MPIQVNLKDVQDAWEFKDPQLSFLIEQLSCQADTKNLSDNETGDEFQKFLTTINSREFQQKPKEEKALFRLERLKSFETGQARAALSDRLKLDEMILTLWHDGSFFARSTLLSVIATVKLTYGPFRAVKRIYKEAEALNDIQVIGALAARFDMAFAGQNHEVSQKTLGYLSRRAWRYLRRVAESLPIFYAEAAVEYLAHYTDETYWNHTWIANHIFFHADRKYSRKQFKVYYGDYTSLVEIRAYPDLWQRTPRPLFALAQRARSEKVRKFAVEALKSDFKTSLRDIEASWVIRIIRVDSAVIHEFAVWLLKNAPRLEQASFRKLGLHEPVLSLFDSKAAKARIYAATYARTYARDLELDKIIRLLENSHETVRKLAFDLLAELNPRKEVGLWGWGKILDTRYGHDYAAQIIRRHFGARDLTKEWFKQRLLSDNANTVAFAKELLPQIHPYKNLGPAFFQSLLEEVIRIYPDTPGKASNLARFALKQLSRFDINTLRPELLKCLFIHPTTQRTLSVWFDEGRLAPSTLPMAFYKTLAYFPAWKKDHFICGLKNESHVWVKILEFNEALSDQMLLWLKDKRRFSPHDVGFSWLMTLAARSEPKYHKFASDMLVSAFGPADFAEKVEDKEATYSQTVQNGWQKLWEMACGPGKQDEPIRKFAVKYLRLKHPQISLAETERPVDSKEQVPLDFLTYKRVKPLFADPRPILRDLALAYARWEFARWQVTPDELIELCELFDPRIRQFVQKALLAEKTPENQPFRLAAGTFSPEAVYEFCESTDAFTRQLGMTLIRKYPRFQLPNELFRLTESPDRRLQGFVISTIWALYRRQKITANWHPKDRKPDHEEFKENGPLSETDVLLTPFAAYEELYRFLRRILFEIPPARSEKNLKNEGRVQLKPLPARKAKLAMVEIMRDLAIEDEAFARVILPLLEEFMQSKGKSEMAACLVAVTRIKANAKV